MAKTINGDYNWIEDIKYVCPTCYKKDEAFIIYAGENYCPNDHKINWDKVVELDMTLENHRMW